MSGGLYVGIDVGSSATKCVVLDAGDALVSHAVVPSGFDYAQAAQSALDQALADDGLARRAIVHCVSTGYGRANVRFADRHVTEITCHARGARQWYPQVRAIVDIGGQDTKVIWIDSHGELVDYRMNSKCAAGTGTFLESIALRLGVPLGTIDELALTSTARTVVNSYCTVFAGTEVIERIKAGEPRQDIAMGLFRSIAARIFEMLAARNGPVAATGGVVAHCKAMVRSLEEVLGAPLLLPPLPQQAGAYGAALLAREWGWRDAPAAPRPAVRRVHA
jgi:predicted CoA-substrate-specific enzyme activase